MSGVFQNAAMVLSMGIFFTLMISGISSVLPRSLYRGLVHQHVPVAVATAVSHLPPITSLFASLLGYNPIRQILGRSVLAQLPHHSAKVLSGPSFFPDLLSQPFAAGLTIAFTFGAVACALAALASLMRGGRYVHGMTATAAAQAEPDEDALDASSRLGANGTGRASLQPVPAGQAPSPGDPTERRRQRSRRAGA